METLTLILGLVMFIAPTVATALSRIPRGEGFIADIRRGIRLASVLTHTNEAGTFRSLLAVRPPVHVAPVVPLPEIKHLAAELHDAYTTAQRRVTTAIVPATLDDCSATTRACWHATANRVLDLAGQPQPAPSAMTLPVKMLFLLAMLPMLIGCGMGSQVRQTPAQQAAIALDTAACVATDVLPGVPQLVDHLADQGASVAERTILGLISGVGAVSKSVACYLRASASVKTQTAPPAPVAALAPCVAPQEARGLLPGERLCDVGETGEVRKVDDAALIHSRAKCTGGGCRREAIMARLLVAAESHGLVLVR